LGRDGAVASGRVSIRTCQPSIAAFAELVEVMRVTGSLLDAGVVLPLITRLRRIPERLFDW
jgi:hypothetical protein